MHRPGFFTGGRISLVAAGLALAVVFPAASALFGFGHSTEHKQGSVSGTASNYDTALAYDNNAIQADPNNTKNYLNRGMVYMLRGDTDKAIADFSEAIQLDPQNAKAYVYRGTVHGTKGDKEGNSSEYDLAIADFNSAINLDARNAQAYFGRGSTYAAQHKYDKAIADYALSVQYDPTQAEAYNNFAWVLATCPQASLRDGKKALEYATKSCQLSQWKEAASLDTLAAAYAETGDFDNAIKWETVSMQIPNQASKDIADDQDRLVLYQAHKPYHEAE